VINFRNWPKTIAEACRKAAENLNSIEGKPGRPTISWYRDFARVLAFVAEKNGLLSTIEKDFVRLAERFEALLPLHMRSPTLDVRVQRLKRVRRKLRKG
jgi:hypothetical protein